MTFTTYKILPHLPQVPEEIIQQIDLDHRPKINDLGYYHERQLRNWYGRDFAAMINVRTAHDEFASWARANIISDFIDAGVNYVLYNREDGLPSSTGAHTDGTRNFTVIYNLRTGGPNAMTCFWQERNQDLYRPRKTQGEDLTELVYVDSIFIPEKTWTIIDTRILHSVEHLYSSRISLQISLDEHPW